MTVGVLLLTHEGIGTSLMRVARRLFGAEPELPLDAYEATWDDDADTQLPAASAALRRVDRGDGVLLLAAAPGATLVLRVEGEDEADALAACAALFERRFDEDD